MRILLEVYNKFTKEIEISVIMPYDPHKAMNGFYSRFLKHLKKGAIQAHGLEGYLFRLMAKKVHGKSRRTVFTFACGVVIDMPYDATPHDYEILLAQLNVIQMSRR